jgi:hypothetical protein
VEQSAKRIRSVDLANVVERWRCPPCADGLIDCSWAEIALRAPGSLGLMTTAEDDASREHESQATEAPVPVTETPTSLQQAAAGIAEAQAWKGQQIAKGWRKLVNALGRHNEGQGNSVS